MRNRWLARFSVEMALGLLGVAFFALTLVVPDWMEARFGLAPDAGDGAAEWAFVLAWAAASALMFALAGRTWTRRPRTPRPA